MIVKRFLILGLLMLQLLPAARADDDIFANEGVTSFQQDEDAWRRGGEKTPEENTAPAAPEILPEIKEAIGPIALNNLENAEKVFCYTVAPRPAEYDGYTLDGMAVTGFCGVIKDEVRELILHDLLMDSKNVLFNVREECVIRPKVILRFVKGIDATDILLSAPCHSFTIYYPGLVKVFNAKPAANVLDTIVSTMEKNKVDFISPALLDQLLPVGVPQTAEQRELVSKRAKPIRSWVDDSKKEEAPKTEKKGWNNLDLGF